MSQRRRHSRIAGDPGGMEETGGIGGVSVDSLLPPFICTRVNRIPDTPPRGLQTRHYRHPRSPGHSSRGSSSTSLESSSSENGRSQGYETSQGRGIDDAAGSTGITNQSHNDDGPVASEQRRPSVLETPQMCENNIRASPTATTATHQPSDGGSVTFAIGPGYPLDSNSNLDEASWDDQEARFPEKGNV